LRVFVVPTGGRISYFQVLCGSQSNDSGSG
jgi:hypothetical protein